jgi:hypothetical protein
MTPRNVSRISNICYFQGPYLRNINRESFDYQGINSVDELKQEWHQYKSLHARAISGFFKGLSKLDKIIYLSDYILSSERFNI